MRMKEAFSPITPEQAYFRRRAAEKGSLLVPALFPDSLKAVIDEYAGGKIKVYQNPNEDNERVIRTQRTDIELEDGLVSLERWTSDAGFIVMPAPLIGIRVKPNEGKARALVALQTDALKPSYKFEDIGGNIVGFAFGKDIENVEAAIIKDLGFEDPRIEELAKAFVSPELIRWIRLSFLTIRKYPTVVPPNL